jgi:DNA-binding GntR family transcriptional regulator
MRRELPEYFRLNQLIHERIIAAAGNRALEAYYHGLIARMRRLRYSANTIKRDRWGQAMREHEQMIDALRRRDGRELAEILHYHLINKWRAAAETLEVSGG